MPGEYLLDTNIVIALLDEDPVVLERLSAAQHVFLSSTALGELYYGVENSLRREENRRRLDNLVAAFHILPCDIDTARCYGLIRANLKRKGCPIPENDLWIATLSLQHGLVLVTRDKHFHEVPDVTCEDWA
ncbi:MAG TPA: type II toxin-antitoxin system VapC family toxin [Candidatus Hydrogenedentes bacterium]|nr:type II toxin-antitoxin system VapC family toxin [Candidatus Hydrogenedentota bacterium]HNT89941.1 type II toxin-antitoxin system VapC family toxin [Candidatus Hydrogenedentota bacterium]